MLNRRAALIEDIYTRHRPTQQEVALLQALADSTAVAMESIRSHQLSLTDELTGLANRRGFLVRADQARVQTLRSEQADQAMYADKQRRRQPLLAG